jgi:hypothetical protein
MFAPITQIIGEIVLHDRRKIEFLPSLEAKPIKGSAAPGRSCDTHMTASQRAGRPMMGFASLNPLLRAQTCGLRRHHRCACFCFPDAVVSQMISAVRRRMPAPMFSIL